MSNPTTTTTTGNPLSNCETGNVETDLVCHLKAVLGMTRVYHLKVFQKMNAKTVYPCVVYSRDDDTQFMELDGGSGFFKGEFLIVILSANGDTLRDWSYLIANSGNTYMTNGWREWQQDVEDYDASTELAEDGIFQTIMRVTIDRQGK